MKTKSLTRTCSLLSIASVALLTACSTTETKVQTPSVAAQFEAPLRGNSGQSSLEWWALFNDPCLDELLGMVSAENFQLRAAAAKIEEARYLSDAENGNKFPELSASATAQRERLSENGINGASVRNGMVNRTTNYYKGGLDASWEIDLFGENRSQRDAAYERMEASTYAYGALKNSLLSETALNYFRFRIVENRLRAERERLLLYQTKYDLLESQVKAGVLNESELRYADTVIEDSQKTLAAYELDKNTAHHALAILTEHSLSEVESLLQKYDEGMPRTDMIPVAGLPLDLLKNRPDILQAESLLKVEISNLGIRDAALYPHISLIASVGQESLVIDDFSDASSNLLTFGPSLYLPIFNGGQLRNLKKAQIAKVEQYQVQYQDSVMKAIHEVEEALTRIDRVENQFENAQRIQENSRERLRIAQQQYETGVITKLELITQESELLTSEEYLQTLAYNLQMEYVGLGKSLGGGWKAF